MKLTDFMKLTFIHAKSNEYSKYLLNRFIMDKIKETCSTKIKWLTWFYYYFDCDLNKDGESSLKS